VNDHELRGFAESEMAAAKADLGKVGPSEALVRFFRRHDEAVVKARATSAVKPACAAGCSYCCYYKVEARAVEVLAIHQYVISRFTPDQIRAAVDQASMNVSQAKSLSHTEHLTTNQRCPFLVQERCSIYPVRPSKCRDFHAADVQGCKDSFDRPEDLSIPNSYIDGIFESGSGTTFGFEAAVETAGLDSRVYDLNSAFLEAMQNAKSAKRFRAGKKAFLVAKVVASLDDAAF
jgi:Fe-S-cluster containining protein